MSGVFVLSHHRRCPVSHEKRKKKEKKTQLKRMRTDTKTDKKKLVKNNCRECREKRCSP